jgi:chromosomal replication initiation ATPase DnaA
MLSFNHKVNTLKHLIFTRLNVDVNIPTRKRAYVEARFIYFNILRLENYGLAEIGRTVTKDHATVLHGVRQVENWTETNTNKSFMEKYKEILELYKQAPNQLNFEIPSNEELVSIL